MDSINEMDLDAVRSNLRDIGSRIDADTELANHFREQLRIREDSLTSYRMLHSRLISRLDELAPGR